MHATTLPCGGFGETVLVTGEEVRARHAIELGLNVLASSSLVSPALGGLPDACQVNARDITDVRVLLFEVGRALGVGWVEGDAYDQLVNLAKHLWEAERFPTLVLEGLDVSVAVALFGRLRDELWELPATWLVVVSPAVGAVLDQPPSNAFFEVTIG